MTRSIVKSFLITLSLSCTAPVALAQADLDAVLPVRGFCIATPGSNSLNDFIAFVRNELAPRHVNTLVLRVDYRYQYESQPQLRTRDSLSREDVKRLLTVCNTNHIRLIPHINLLGHQSWAGTLGNLLRHYPEFDETPHVKMPDNYKWPNPEGLYCKSYCPLHPKVHDVLFALIDELCDVFEADSFHAGMDEVFYIGDDKCPRCSGHDKAALFAGEVRLIHDYLASKGRRLWIWGDRLLDGKTTGLGEWEASVNGTFRAIDLIPKDVVICDWHYERPDQTAVYFAMKGFQVVTCTYKKPRIGIAQAKDMLKFRQNSTPEMKEKFQGVMQTVWSGAESFLNREYHTQAKGKMLENNPWQTFQAIFEVINRSDGPE